MFDGKFLSIKGIPYTAKHSRGKTFAVFALLYSTANVFHWIVYLITLLKEAANHKTFPVNVHFLF